MRFIKFWESDISIRQKVKYLNESGEKPIKYAIVSDYVRKAFFDLIKYSKEEVVIAGGIAVGVYSRPRTTIDIDILISKEENANELENNIKSKIKRNNILTFEHNSTGVEIDVIMPEYINVSKDLVKKAIETAIIQNVNGKNVKIVTPKYLIALKLARAIKNTAKAKQDQADIMNVLHECGIQDLSDLNLEEKQITLYKKLIEDLKEKD